MKHRRSRLGTYIQRLRKGKGLSRLNLAEMLSCRRLSIVRIEQLGDDENGLLNQLSELLDLDSMVVEQCLKADKKYRQAWICFCSQTITPVILPVGKSKSSPVDVPRRIVEGGNETIEAFARSFAQDWDQSIELFIRNHIRIIISPSGEMEIHELGIYGQWLTESLAK